MNGSGSSADAPLREFGRGVCVHSFTSLSLRQLHERHASDIVISASQKLVLCCRTSLGREGFLHSRARAAIAEGGAAMSRRATLVLAALLLLLVAATGQVRISEF